MGSGAWTTASYCSYVKSTRGIDDVGKINLNSVDQFYISRHLDPALNPKGVKFSACAAVARQLDKIITGLYADVKDVEFMVMGIGDFAYDEAPLQVSQFESDVRICDQLGKIWFERGGGGNMFESYTAAWYFALNHTQLDCWGRGKKGIIITMGDEPLNPYLPGRAFNRVLGYSSQDVDTVELYKQVTEKFDVYHIIITDREGSGMRYLAKDKESWGKLLDGQHLFVKESNELPEVIHDIVTAHVDESEGVNAVNHTEEGITW